MRHMLGNLSPNYFERTKRYMMLRASQQGTDLTVSGTPPLSLPNSLGKPLKAWSVDVLPSQDLHGYDSPWPAGGGKNMLPLSLADIKSANSTYGSWSDNKYTFRGITWTIDIDNAENVIGITANGTATQEAGLIITLPFDINGSYSLSGCPTGGNGTSTYNVRIHNASTSAVIVSDYGSGATFTATNSVLARFVIYTGYTASNVKFYPMLRLSSVSDASFAPYSNICPIYGTDKLNWFVEESYDQSATPKAVLTLPQTVYTGTIGSEGGESRTAVYTFTGNERWNRQNPHDKYYTIAPDNGYLVPDAKLPISNEFSVPIKTSIGDFNTSYNTLHNHSNTICIAADARFGITADLYNPDGGTLAGVQVEYELATPAQFPVPSVTIPTPTGTATTWATAEDGTVDSMDVTYVGKA